MVYDQNSSLVQYNINNEYEDLNIRSQEKTYVCQLLLRSRKEKKHKKCIKRKEINTKIINNTRLYMGDNTLLSERKKHHITYLKVIEKFKL